MTTQGAYVKVTGTLLEMAQSVYGDGTKWTRIWNHPINAGLRTKRGQPKSIHIGDRVWVPK